MSEKEVGTEKEIGIDQPTKQLYEKAQEDGVKLSWDRLDQQKTCPFGAVGLCCRHCNMGPCRINLKGGEPSRGACGVDDRESEEELAHSGTDKCQGQKLRESQDVKSVQVHDKHIVKDPIRRLAQKHGQALAQGTISLLQSFRSKFGRIVKDVSQDVLLSLTEASFKISPGGGVIK